MSVFPLLIQIITNHSSSSSRNTTSSKDDDNVNDNNDDKAAAAAAAADRIQSDLTSLINNVSITFCELWKIIHQNFPNSELPSKTVNCLSISNEGEPSNLSNSELISDPLVVMRINPLLLFCKTTDNSLQASDSKENVKPNQKEQISPSILAPSTTNYNNFIIPMPPSIYELIVFIFNHYLTISTQQIEEQMSLYQNQSESSSNATVSSFGTLLYSQLSAGIQILMENLLNIKQYYTVNSDVNKGAIEEIQSITCTFIHEKFLEKPLLIKLIHFQTYSSQLLPIMVSGIPSMHICLDYIHEILNSPYSHHRLFAVKLGSYLVKRYPIPKSLSIAKLILSYLQQTRTLEVSTIQDDLLNCVELLCDTFPLLIPTVIPLYHDVYKKTRNVLSRISDVGPLSATPDEGNPILCSLKNIISRNIVNNQSTS
eukprot:TRINITY_DN6731_c0_g1_i2.p1 TRINITY_DN6731_c0_g1~~TRINITY_DN6731_c0_g1_i2.p1  ORF type:complete len:495 (-),score=84.24 TRINITY_DN6731_c0_g1_i2:52-1332(-)